jgi:hypothetical protein
MKNRNLKLGLLSLCGGACIAGAIALSSAFSFAAPGNSPELQKAYGRAPKSPHPETPPGPRSDGDLSAREVTDMLSDGMRNDRQEMLSFFEKHTPERFKTFSMFREGGARRARLMEFMTRRYAQLQRTRDNDAKLYELMVQQMEIPQKELRENVRKLIDLTLQERQRRIELLEQSLSEQKAQLEKDRSNIDDLVDEHITKLVEDSKRFIDRLKDLRAAPRNLPSPSPVVSPDTGPQGQ